MKIWCWLGIHRWSGVTVLLDDRSWRDAGCPSDYPVNVGYTCLRQGCGETKVIKKNP